MENLGFFIPRNQAISIKAGSWELEVPDAKTWNLEFYYWNFLLK